MSNEPIKPIEQNYVPYETLFPDYVSGGVEVKDDLIDSNNTYSSEKIEDRLDEVTSSLTQAIEDIDLSPYQLTSAKDTANGYMGANINALLDADKIDYSLIERIFEDFNFTNYTFDANSFSRFTTSTPTTYVRVIEVSGLTSGFYGSAKNLLQLILIDGSASYSTCATKINKYINNDDLSNNQIFEIEILSSTFSNDGTFWFGLGQSYVTSATYNDTNNPNAIFIKYDQSESLYFSTNVCSSSVNTKFITNVTKAAKTVYKLKIKVDIALNTIYFYINDSLIDSRTVNRSFLAPTTSSNSPFIYFYTSMSGGAVATTRLACIDYIDIKIKRKY